MRKPQAEWILIDASTLAATWNLEFRVLKRGFSAWLIAGLDAQYKCIFRSRSKLTWRRAAELLSGLEDQGLEGDWVGDVVVAGVPEWQACMLELCAITINSPCPGVAEILLGLDDHRIEEVYRRFNCLCCPEARLSLKTDEPDDISTCEELIVQDDLTWKLEREAQGCSPTAMSDCLGLLEKWARLKIKPKASVVCHVNMYSIDAWLVWLLKDAPAGLLEQWSKENASGAAFLRRRLNKSLLQAEAFERNYRGHHPTKSNKIARCLNITLIRAFNKQLHGG